MENVFFAFNWVNMKTDSISYFAILNSVFEQLSFTYRQHQDSSRGSWKTISTRKTGTTRRTLKRKIRQPWVHAHRQKCGILLVFLEL